MAPQQHVSTLLASMYDATLNIVGVTCSHVFFATEFTFALLLILIIYMHVNTMWPENHKHKIACGQKTTV